MIFKNFFAFSYKPKLENNNGWYVYDPEKEYKRMVCINIWVFLLIIMSKKVYKLIRGLTRRPNGLCVSSTASLSCATRIRAIWSCRGSSTRRRSSWSRSSARELVSRSSVGSVRTLCPYCDPLSLYVVCSIVATITTRTISRILLICARKSSHTIFFY